jgi:hypothetical protein
MPKQKGGFASLVRLVNDVQKLERELDDTSHSRLTTKPEDRRKRLRALHTELFIRYAEIIGLSEHLMAVHGSEEKKLRMQRNSQLE